MSEFVTRRSSQSACSFPAVTREAVSISSAGPLAMIGLALTLWRRIEADRAGVWLCLTIAGSTLATGLIFFANDRLRVVAVPLLLPLVDLGPYKQDIERIVEGKLAKFYEEVCLMEQPFIKDTAITVQELVQQSVHQAAPGKGHKALRTPAGRGPHQGDAEPRAVGDRPWSSSGFRLLIEALLAGKNMSNTK